VIKFQVEGLKNFGKEGFDKHAKAWNPSDMDVDMTGKVVMITGSNSGLGFEAARELAKKKATVVMVCRSKDKGEKARSEIVTATGNENVKVLVADMCRPGDIKKLAEDYLKSGDRLDVLINNAGAIVDKREMTPENIEKTFATNTLSSFLLTEYLLPALEKSKPSRVVMVSSGGQYSVKMDVKDFQMEHKSYDGTLAYAYTKRHQRYITELWGKKYADKGIYFGSMHPGWARTPGTQNSLPKWFDKLNLRNALEGADTMIWLAVKKENPTEPNGTFFFDRKKTKTDMTSGTESDQKDLDTLWDYVNKWKEPLNVDTNPKSE